MTISCNPQRMPRLQWKLRGRRAALGTRHGSLAVRALEIRAQLGFSCAHDVPNIHALAMCPRIGRGVGQRAVMSRAQSLKDTALKQREVSTHGEGS